MKKILTIITIIFTVGIGIYTYKEPLRVGATTLFPYQGGTGTGVTPTIGQILVGNSSGIYVPTSGYSSFPFTPTTNYGVNVNATSTPIWFQNGVMASTTSYFANASTTQLTTTGSTYLATAGGNVGIGTIAPATPLQVLSTNYTYPTLGTVAGNFSIVGSSGLYGLFAGVNNATAQTWLQSMRTDGATATDLLLQPKGGNVGIGTTTPASTLTVAGQGTGTAQIGSTGFGGNYVGISLSGALDTTNYNFLSSATNPLLWINRPAGGDISFRENNVAQMTIVAGTGNVGIGTTIPAVKLSVTGYGKVGTGADSWGGNNGFQIKNSTITETSLSIWQEGVASALIGSKSNDANLYITNDYAGAGLGNAATSITINSIGNVGIGTTAPLYKLDVNGTSHYTGSLTLAQPVQIGFANGQYIKDNGLGGLAISSGNSINNTVAGGGFYTIMGGNVGIGTTAPLNTLDIKSTSSINRGLAGTIAPFRIVTGTGLTTDEGLMMGVHDGDYSWIQAGKPGTSARNLALQSDGGNVGIGTTAPGYALDVKNTLGNISLTSTTGTNSVLYRAVNTGGTLYMGKEDSASGTFGQPAYASLLFSTGAYPLVFGTNSARQMLIDSTGNVSIGTNLSPAAKLDILDNTLAGSGALAGSILNLAQTWNTTGTPTAIKLNVTNTASNASSLLMDLQVGGVSKFKVDNTGAVTAAQTIATAGTGSFGGTITAPALNRGTGFSLGIDNLAHSVAGLTNITMSSGINTAVSGVSVAVGITPTYNQTSTAGATDLLINRTETAVGSGAQLLIDAQVGGVSKFSVSNTGNGYFAGNVGIGTTTPTTQSKLTILGGIGTDGLPPVLSACGTSPAITSGSTDTAGLVTEGTVATGCTITFQTPKTRAPFCTVEADSGLAFSKTVSASAITITNIGALSSTALSYVCVNNDL